MCSGYDGRQHRLWTIPAFAEEVGQTETKAAKDGDTSSLSEHVLTVEMNPLLLKWQKEMMMMMMMMLATMDKRESGGEEALHLSDRITQDRNHYPQWSPQTNMTNYDNENI